MSIALQIYLSPPEMLENYSAARTDGYTLHDNRAISEL